MRAVLPHCLPVDSLAATSRQAVGKSLGLCHTARRRLRRAFVKEREPGSLEQGAMEQHTLRTRSPLLRITDGQCAVGRDCVGRQSAPESDGIGVRGHGTSVWLATAAGIGYMPWGTVVKYLLYVSAKKKRNLF